MAEEQTAPAVPTPQNSIIQTDEKTGEWRIDVAAFLPDPAGHLKINGVDYPIYSFLDIPVEDSLRVVKLAEDISKTDSYDERMARSIEQILMLNRGPAMTAQRRLTEAHLRGISPRHLIALTVMATSIAQVPQKAAAGSDNGSPSSAPASADSTVGATQS